MDSHDLDKKDVRRPMNAFLIFCKRHRTMVREKNPNLDNRSVTRILGDLWANLKEDEKSQYTDLAKQYKDAFMRANPDYKWHNPDKLGTAVSVTKSSTRPSSVRQGGKEDECHVEGSIVSGKLADPSNMGGLSLLLMAGQQSANKQSSNVARVTSPTPSHSSGSLLELAEMCSTKLQHNGQNLVEGSQSNHSSDIENQLLDLTNKKLHPSHDSNSQSGETFKSHDLKSSTGLAEERLSNWSITEVGLDLSRKKTIKCEEKGEGQGSGDNLSRECFPDVNESITKFVQSSQKGNSAPPEDYEEETGDNVLEDTESGKTEEEDENAILTCGKVMMDHIIEKLFSSDLGPRGKQKVCYSEGQPDVKTVSSASQATGHSDLPKSNCDEIFTAQNSSVDEIKKEKNGDHLKLPSLPLKMSIKEEFIKGDNFRSRKRCYSEPCADHYENHLPPKKLQRMFIGFTSEADGSDQSGVQGQGSRSGDSENADDTTGEDEFQPVRKSKRRNRGQRYQELINEGIIQPSKERLAAIKGETTITCKQEESNSDEEPTCKKEELAFDVLSVYPRQIRKRTCSESEKTRTQHDEIKRYKTGDFDLEAHIATLPACSLEKVTRANKRIVGKPRSVSESGGPMKRPVMEEAPVEVVLSVPPHLKCLEKPANKEPIVGSRKRKARKHSITHLQLLPPDPAGVPRVNEKFEARIDTTIPDQKPGHNRQDNVKSLSTPHLPITEINQDKGYTLPVSCNDGLKTATKYSVNLPQSVRNNSIGDAQAGVKFPISNDLDLRMSKDLLVVDKKKENVEGNILGDDGENSVADKVRLRLSPSCCALNNTVKEAIEVLSKGNNSAADNTVHVKEEIKGLSKGNNSAADNTVHVKEKIKELSKGNNSAANNTVHVKEEIKALSKGNNSVANNTVHVREEPEALSKGNNSVTTTVDTSAFATCTTLVKEEVKHVQENNEISCKLKHSEMLTDMSVVKKEFNFGDQNVMHSVEKSDNSINQEENVRDCDKTVDSVSTGDQGGTSAASYVSLSSNAEKVSVLPNQFMKLRNITEFDGLHHQEETMKGDSTAPEKVCANNETGGQVRKSTLEKLRRTLKGDNSMTREKTDSTKLCDNVSEKEKCHENLTTVKTESKDSVEFLPKLRENTRLKSESENNWDSTLHEDAQHIPELGSYYNNNNSSKLLASILSKKATERKEVVDASDSNTSSKILASILSKERDETEEVVRVGDSVVAKSESDSDNGPKTKLVSSDMLQVEECAEENHRMMPVSSESDESNGDMNHSLENLLATTGSVSSSPIPMAAVKS